MLSRISRVLLFFAFSLGLASSATAQGTPASGMGEIAGLESAYGRIYIVDPENIFATPDLLATLALEDFPFMGRTAVYTFKDEGAAAANVEAVAEKDASEAFEGADVEKSEIEVSGEAAYQYTGEVKVEAGLSMTMVLIFVQDGANVLVTQIIGGAEPADMALAWAGFMLDAEIGDEEITLVDDGTSTGGVFELMPSAEDEELRGGLSPVADIDLLANAE